MADPNEMTAKALKILEQDKDGFFLMVEAGQIDWAEHNQDAGQLLHEMIRLDHTIKTVRDWAADRDDTLIIITADHDTGGFTLSYSTYDLPKKSTDLSGNLFTDHDYQPGKNYGDFATLDLLYNQRMSFASLWGQFNDRKSGEPNPAKLAGLVSKVTGVKISLADANRILRKRENPYRIADDRFLHEETMPDLGNKQVFYTNPMNMLSGLVAQRIGIEQNISWATGTHSASPV
ncbi:alkaline phosphatase, partial [bacterium]|nr:alkaline phosphatase [bacterium]